MCPCTTVMYTTYLYISRKNTLGLLVLFLDLKRQDSKN